MVNIDQTWSAFALGGAPMGVGADALRTTGPVRPRPATMTGGPAIVPTSVLTAQGPTHPGGTPV